MGWDSYNSRVPKLNDLIALKALNITVKQAVSEINFPGKKIRIMWAQDKNMYPKC